MSVLRRRDLLISPEEYLAGEELVELKHEYVCGVVYATAAARNRHNQIAVNALLAFGTLLRGHRCSPLNADTKVRVRNGTDIRFYYPDAMLVCERNSEEEMFQDQPVVLVEVTSESTSRTDRSEKWLAYRTIASLRCYLVVAQDHVEVVAYRRTNGGEWSVEAFTDFVESISLPELDCALSVADLYERTGLAKSGGI